MKLTFTKMQGAGNDFVVLDGVRQPIALDVAQLRFLADRHFGVGADQILLVEPADGPDVDFRYRIFNADGQEVEQCGNGARCFVKFVHEAALTDKRAIRVATLGGIIEPRLEDDGWVSVNMGVPRFGPSSVGFDAAGLSSRQDHDAQLWTLDAPCAEAEVMLVSMGNPHAVQCVDDVAQAPVTEQGPLIEQHRRFARGINAGFIQCLNRSGARVRVWERGSGETLACGTGACAAVVSAMARDRLDGDVRVQVRGGQLRVRWAGPGQAVMLSGPAATVFTGEITL